MNKYVKLLATVLTVALVGTTISGCGKTGSTASKGGKTIKVWSHLNESEVNEVRKVANEWAKETGNKVDVKVDKSDFQAFSSAAQSSKGPDIMFGLAHDNLGVFQKAGLLDEVPSGVITDSDYSSKSVLDAVTWNGKRYALPIAMETYALFYNKDMVKDVPKTMDDLIQDAKADGGFQYDINNFYYSYAFISAFGGYVFKQKPGSLDPKDVGLGNDGSKQAYKYIQDLTQVYKFMKGDVKDDDAKAAFSNKKIAFYISGPWCEETFTKAGVNYGITTLPSVNGKPARPFMGVQTAFVSSNSKNKSEDWDLLKTLIKKCPEPLFKTGGRIPTLKAELDKDYVKNDKMVNTFIEETKNAEPMPNIPEMSAVWTPVGNNLQLLTQGKQDAAKTAQLMKQQVEEGIAQQK